MTDDIALTSDGLIKNLLNNLPTGYTKKLVKLPNGKFTTPASSKWLRVSFIDGAKSNVEAGGSYKRTNALFVIDSFYPKGLGDQAQLQELKVLGDLYENKEIGNAKCFEADPSILGEDGSWYHCQVTINLYYEGE
tara:strand:- start:3443 stop:3847 length:405 start_codon:yes stop_codon:yes gene_type:complete